MKTILIFLGIVLGLLALTAAVAFFGIGFWLSPQSPLAKSDVIVAISGGETTSRADEAILLYKQGWAPKIIFSGAALDPNSPSNALAMKKIAIASGVPATDILLDEVSINTEENAVGVNDILSLHGWRQIILVTSPYHQRRANLSFSRELGSQIKILNHSTIDHKWRRSYWWANSYSSQVTITELQKAFYVWLQGPGKKPVN